MDEELKQLGYFEDPATGFLDKKEKNTFGAFEKTKFLKALKVHGNQSKAAHDLGYSIRVIDLHLRKDLVFKQAHEETLLEMRHEIEGDLYTAGLAGNAKKAQMWLQAFFPETYKPTSRPVTKKDDTSAIDALYKKL